MRQGKGGCPIRTHKNVISKDKGKNKEKENASSGPEAVHNNARIRHEMQRMAQREFEKRYGHAKFMEVFGRNFLGPSGENDEEMVRADRKRD